MSLAFSRRLPVYCLLISILLGVVLLPWPAAAMVFLSSETGVIELGTVVAAVCGAWAAALIVRDARYLPHPALAVWFALFVVGLVFLAGEESSWGQSWFRWATPEDYAALNMQGETNLHNLSKWSEQLPKLALVLAALFGGVVWPILAHVRKTGPYLRGWFGWVWPGSLVWPAAALTILMRVLERLMVATNLEDLSRPVYLAMRESIELYGVLFVLAYLWDVRRRQLSQKPPGA